MSDGISVRTITSGGHTVNTSRNILVTAFAAILLLCASCQNDDTTRPPTGSYKVVTDLDECLHAWPALGGCANEHTVLLATSEYKMNSRGICNQVRVRHNCPEGSQCIMHGWCEPTMRQVGIPYFRLASWYPSMELYDGPAECDAPPSAVCWTDNKLQHPEKTGIKVFTGHTGKGSCFYARDFLEECPLGCKDGACNDLPQGPPTCRYYGLAAETQCKDKHTILRPSGGHIHRTDSLDQGDLTVVCSEMYEEVACGEGYRCEDGDCFKLPPQAPKALPQPQLFDRDGQALPEEESTWEWMLHFAVKNFTSTSAVGRGWEEEDHKDVVQIVYGMLYTLSWSVDIDNSHEFLRETLGDIYSSRVLQRLLFAWAMPVIEDAYTEMPPDEARVYLGALYYAREYLTKRWNYKRERTHLEQLERGECDRPAKCQENPHGWRCDCIDRFVDVDPKGVARPFRKIEAWFFRRQHLDGVNPRKTFLPWINKVIRLLEPIHGKPTSD
jgi:hypothetical protein